MEVGEMAKKRLPMRKVREVLRLRTYALSQRQVGASLGMGRSTVKDYLDRARVAGLRWPLPDDLDDEALEQRLFPSVRRDVANTRAEIDCVQIDK